MCYNSTSGLWNHSMYVILLIESFAQIYTFLWMTLVLMSFFHLSFLSGFDLLYWAHPLPSHTLMCNEDNVLEHSYEKDNLLRRPYHPWRQLVLSKYYHFWKNNTVSVCSRVVLVHCSTYSHWLHFNELWDYLIKEQRGLFECTQLQHRRQYCDQSTIH